MVACACNKHLTSQVGDTELQSGLQSLPQNEHKLVPLLKYLLHTLIHRDKADSIMNETYLSGHLFFPAVLPIVEKET